jgi:hypothetical protein
VGFFDWFRDAWSPITEEVAVVPVTESYAMGAMAYDPDANHTAAQVGTAYSRRLSGPNPRRDLDPMTADRARDIAAALYIGNPLGRRLPEITRDWLMGEGMSIVVEPDEGDIARRDRQPMQEANDISGRAKKRQNERQQIVDRFWNAPGNNLDLRLYDHVLGLRQGADRRARRWRSPAGD